MAGGIAILLLVIALVAIGVVVLALQGTGGFLWWRKTDPRGDRVEGEDPDRRPTHSAPTNPAQEHTEFAGSSDEPPR
jgi:uncharacterized iron-regulated membrane protein